MFALPSYARAANAFIVEAFHALMRAKDPVLSMMKVEVVETLPPNRVTLESGVSVESPTIGVGAAFTLDVPEMISGRFESLYVALDAAADLGLSTLMPAFFRHISDVTSATGQTSDAGGRPIIEAFIEMIETMEVNFDDEDQPTFSLVMHPDMAEKIRAQGAPSQEALKRLRDVIERKRVEYHRRRDSRRLS
jgi:hypothetical protein